MEQLKFLSYQTVVAVVFILTSLWIERSYEMQVCQYGKSTNQIITMSMHSTLSNAVCSCKMTVNGTVKLSLFPDMRVQRCTAKLLLSDVSYNFECMNGRITSPPPFKTMKAADPLWLFVSATGSTVTINGTLQIKTPIGFQVTLECFDENTNSSETTTKATTSSLARSTTSETTTYRSTSSAVQLPSASTAVSGNSVSTGAFTSDNKPSTEGQTLEPRTAESSPTADSGQVKNETEFPVAAVAGGIAGGLLLIIILILAVVCFRKRNQKPNLLENGGQPVENQGYQNRAYDSGVPPIGEMKPQNTQPLDNETHVHVENDLYASADTDNHQPLQQVGVMNNVPDHYASPEDLNIDKSDVESVEGSEIVITSSGDLYAVVDKSKKHQDHLVTDPDSTGPSADVYAVVNKKQDPQDIDTPHTVSPSGDVYAVVDRNNVRDPTDIDATHMVSPSGDVYAVVDKSMGAQEKDATDMVSPSPFVLPEADADDQMTRATTHDDDEEEAIRRVMDMGDEREDSDTLQSTAL